MNAEQFTEFIQLQREQQQQISDLLQQLVLQQQRPTAAAPTPATPDTESTSSANTNDNCNKLTIIKNFKCDTFNPATTSIEYFLDFFDKECDIWDVSEDDTRKELLISCLAPEVFHDLKVALVPDFENSLYKDVKFKLLDLHRLKTTKFQALSEFWNCVRDCNETMEHYAIRLKKLATDCGYKDDLFERMLRDRFATGINHPQLEVDLKQKWPDLQEHYDGKTVEVTFAKFFAVAQARELAEGDIHVGLPAATNKVRTKTNMAHHNKQNQISGSTYIVSREDRNKIMTSIAGKYQHYKNEDIDDYFSAVGVPYMGRKMMSVSSPLMEISVDGDYMTIKSSSLLRTVENKFKLGEEYVENMPNAKVKSVTTLINEKQIETKSVVEDTGANCGRHYDFTEDECIVTLTHENAKTPAKRYFRRVQ